MVEKISFFNHIFYLTMKKIILLLTIILGVISFTYAQEIKTYEEEEEFEESHDDRIKNSHLNPFRNSVTGEVDYDKIKEIHSFIDKKISDSKNRRVDAAIPYIEWEERGPNNFAGRIQKIMYDPNDPLFKKVWAGSNSTGLFYNDDIEDPNSSWVATNMHEGPAGIRDITFDPTNTQIFYVAASGGIYKSTDAGQTWINVSNTIYAYDLEVISSTEMYAGTSDGLKKSTNGGATWTTILKPSVSIGGIFTGTVSSGVNSVTSVERSTDGTLFVAFGCGQIFKSDVTRVTWANILAPENPSVGGSTLIGLAQSTSGNTQVIYVVCARTTSGGWFRKSIDGGNNWTTLTWPTGFIQFYDNFVLKIHPNDPNIVFSGTTSLARSINGGTSWTSLGYTYTGGYQGADWHDIIFKPTDPTKATIANDQGVSFWTNVNSTSIAGQVRYKNFMASQVHWGAMRQIANDNIFAANPQDHALKIVSGTGAAPGSPFSANGSLNNNEGMWAKFDDDQPNLLLYTSMVGVHLYLKDLNTNNNLCVTCGSPSLPSLIGWSVYFGGGNNFSRDYDSQTNMAIAFHYVDGTVPGRVWFRRIMNVSPTVSASTNQIIDFYIDGLFANDGVSNLSWIPAYGYQDNLEFPITIKLGKTPGTLFISGMSNVGTTAGGNYGGVLYKVSNFMSASPTLTRLNPFNTVSSPNRFSNIPFMPIAIGANDNELFVPCFKATTEETLFYTNDGGTTWRNLKKAGTSAQTGLPANFSANQAIFNPLNYKQVILSTEYGIWTCDDITVPIPKWEITNAKFGKIPCRNIEIRPSDGTVMVATYGRGLFTTKLNTCQSDIVRTDTINGGVLDVPSSTYIRGTAGNTVQNNGNVRYDAKTYVLLEPNFEVKKGGVFQAKIGGCN